MKRRLTTIIFLLLLLCPLAADETPGTSFGVQLSIDYQCVTENVSIWNLRYGLGIDLLFRVDSPFYLGLETGAFFGFHKANITDPNFDRISVSFPLHATATVFLEGFFFQLAGGLVSEGWADLVNGMVYASDFTFRFYPDLGIKIGIGTVTALYLKAGYTFSEEGYFTFGLGARLGLF